MIQFKYNGLSKLLLIVLMIGLLIISCKKENQNKKVDTQKQKIVEKSTFKNVDYVYDNGNLKLDVTVKKAPQRAVIFSQFLTEMLLSLGLEDRIVLGTSEGKILPSLQKAYDKIPNKALGHHYPITREAFLLLNPDFVSGWDGAVKPETTGSPEELLKSDIYPYTVHSIRSNSTLEDVYKEFLLLGRIFNIEKRADSLVKSLKGKLEKAKENFKKPSDGKKIKAAILRAKENGVYVTSSLISDLMRQANGVNAFEELPNDFELVSHEAVVAADPDIIFVYESVGGQNIKERVEFIKNHPVLKDLTAVKNNNIHTILLPDAAPGVRNIDLIIKMNSLFYK